jgi:hypothetical protein
MKKLKRMKSVSMDEKCKHGWNIVEIDEKRVQMDEKCDHIRESDVIVQDPFLNLRRLFPKSCHSREDGTL